MFEQIIALELRNKSCMSANKILSDAIQELGELSLQLKM